MLALTTLSFDIAGLELLLPRGRSTGGDRGSRTAFDPRRLGALLDAEAVTVMQGTPATWRLLLRGGWAGRASMKALVGGEALSVELAGQIRGRCRHLLNLYGPTEATIWSSVEEVDDAACVSTYVTLGKPLAGLRQYVVDAYGEVAPPGVAGELWIGGGRLARGYWSLPDKTAERFVPDPFGAVPGARLYRTGDRVRMRTDGRLEFLGRIDHQIKLRGFRVEPAEIEAALARHPAVREALVVAQERGPLGSRLVGYWTGTPAPSVEGAELSAFLRESLPEYMVPSAYVRLDAFPLTASGKIDRRSLPSPDEQAPAPDVAAAEPPRTETQQVVAGIWREVLGLERVGIRDNFFDVGGHSLSLVEVHARLEVAFPESGLRVVDLFRYSTVEAVAERLAGGAPAGDGPEPDRRESDAGRERLARRRARLSAGSEGR